MTSITVPLTSEEEAALIAQAKADLLPVLKSLCGRVPLAPAVRPLLLTIRSNGYWLTDALVDAAAKLAGE